MTHRFWVTSLLSLAFSFNAHANLDPLSGARVSVAATQKLMAAQPLPSMSSDKSATTVQASWFLIKIDGKDKTTSNQYHGDFTGNAFGLGYSSEVRGGVGWYLTGFYNSFDGNAHPEAGFPHEFKTTGTAVTGGYSYRLYGRGEDSGLSVGVFGGPTVMYFDSDLLINVTTYNSKPLIYGAQAGLQVRFERDKLSITPYAIHMKEFSDECKKVTSAAGTVSPGEGCPPNSQASPADASFTAFGAVLGYKRFQFNVYTEVLNDDSYDDLTFWDFAVSYSW